MSLSEALQMVRTWPLEDRLEFVFRLWDQIVEEGQLPPPSEELKGELDRRWSAYKADPTRGLTWDQVLASVKRPH